MEVVNTLAYYDTATVTALKRFIEKALVYTMITMVDPLYIQLQVKLSKLWKGRQDTQHDDTQYSDTLHSAMWHFALALSAIMLSVAFFILILSVVVVIPIQSPCAVMSIVIMQSVILLSVTPS